MAEPASTWLSNLGLEAELRAAVCRASAGFAEEFFRTQGHAEEEGHVASLLVRLETQLEKAQQARIIGNPDPMPVELAGQYRRIPKSEEATVHADLTLTVIIDVSGEIDTTFAELIQVKKSNRLASPGDADTWRIDVDQLNGILGLSPTAVYWLLGSEGDIHVIPAKLIWAVGKAKGKLEQGTFTLPYTAVRHAAISLAAYLVDLTIDGWLGSQAPETLDLASGNPETTSARNYFELTVRRSLG